MWFEREANKTKEIESRNVLRATITIHRTYHYNLECRCMCCNYDHATQSAHESNSRSSSSKRTTTKKNLNKMLVHAFALFCTQTHKHVPQTTHINVVGYYVVVFIFAERKMLRQLSHTTGRTCSCVCFDSNNQQATTTTTTSRHIYAIAYI